MNSSNPSQPLDFAFHPQQVAPDALIASGAVVVGDVTLAAGSSVWFNATLRGDVERIVVGAGSNIQEGSILHADPGFPCEIGAGVTVGHGAVVHGARVGDNCIIGIRAVLLNGSVVGENSIVGACALLDRGQGLPARLADFGHPRQGRAPVDAGGDRSQSRLRSPLRATGGGIQGRSTVSVVSTTSRLRPQTWHASLGTQSVKTIGWQAAGGTPASGRCHRPAG